MEKFVQIMAAQRRPKRADPVEPILFGPWLPDRPDWENQGCTEAKNVFPLGPTSYGPIPALSAYSTTALSAFCQGAIAVGDTSQNTIAYAGDATKLYALVAKAWEDRTQNSVTHALSGDDKWEFVKYGNFIIALAQTEVAQSITIGATGKFADHFTSTLKPKAKHGAKVGRFLMLLNVDEGGTVYPDRVRWSAIDDSQDMDAAAANLSSNRDLGTDDGEGQRVFGVDKDAVVFMERSIYTGVFEGAPTVFRFDRREENRGLLAPGGIQRIGRVFFYVAQDGFFMFDGLQSHPIGATKVNQWFFDNVDTNEMHGSVSSAIDNERNLWVIGFPTPAAAANTNDRILAYHWPSGWWGYGEVNHQIMFNDLSQGLTLDELDTITTDLDALTPSLDSRAWKGGVVQVGMFDTNNNNGTLSGANLEATIETSRLQLVQGMQSSVSGFIPLADGGTLTGQVAATKRLNDSETFTTETSQSADGKIPAGSSATGRYHKFRLKIAAGGSWMHAQGVQPISTTTGGP